MLKVYYDSRGWASRIIKSLENVLLAGQTSYMPWTRRRIEAECMAIWKKHGFRVFETFPEIKVQAPQCPKSGYMLFECVEKPKLWEYMRDESRTVDERFALYRRWLAEWSRRHDIAIRDREPRLVHENGDPKHIMIMEDESFLWFDFEMIYRSRRRVAQHVSHELIQYTWWLYGNVPEEMRERLLDETVAHYPARERLQDAYAYFWEHPNPFHRLGRAFERAYKAKARKPNSKYGVARAIRDRLNPA